MHLIEDYYSNSCACDRYNDIYDLCFSSPLKVQIKVNQHSKRRKTIHSKPKKNLNWNFLWSVSLKFIHFGINSLNRKKGMILSTFVAFWLSFRFTVSHFGIIAFFYRCRLQNLDPSLSSCEAQTFTWKGVIYCLIFSVRQGKTRQSVLVSLSNSIYWFAMNYL